MAESSIPPPDSSPDVRRVILLERDGELSTFAGILEELGLEVDRRASGLPDADEFGSVCLIVASAQRLLESSPPHLSSWPMTIVVVQDSSKTLSAHLHRIGASMILRRHIHPQALRLLLLHCVYYGPERRIRKRTPVGYPIRVGAGFFKTKATLLELSPSGARIEMSKMPEVGTQLRVHLGKDLTRGRSVRLETKVMRRIDKPFTADQGHPEVGLALLNSEEHSQTIQAILDRFADGPAAWRSAKATSTPKVADECLEPKPSEEDCGVPESLGTSRVDETDESPTILDDANQQSIDTGSEERRSQTRVPYNRRLVALDQEAARVLVGCDLSSGGMRVASNTSVQIDDVLRIALHCGTQMEPLVVMARALRDDGEDGLVLRFEDLDERQRNHLEKIIASNGPIRSTQPAETVESNGSDTLVVGELLDMPIVCEHDDGENEVSS